MYFNVGDKVLLNNKRQYHKETMNWAEVANIDPNHALSVCMVGGGRYSLTLTSYTHPKEKFALVLENNDE